MKSLHRCIRPIQLPLSLAILAVSLCLLFHKTGSGASPDRIVASPAARLAAAKLALNGLRCNRAGQYDRAWELLTEARHLDGENPVIYTNLGDADNGLQEYDRAIDEYTDALRRDPHAAQAYAGRAQAYQMRHAYDYALGDWDNACWLDPENPRNFAGRATLFAATGQTDAANADIARSRRLSAASQTAGRPASDKLLADNTKSF